MPLCSFPSANSSGSFGLWFWTILPGHSPVHCSWAAKAEHMLQLGPRQGWKNKDFHSVSHRQNPVYISHGNRYLFGKQDNVTDFASPCDLLSVLPPGKSVILMLIPPWLLHIWGDDCQYLCINTFQLVWLNCILFFCCCLVFFVVVLIIYSIC